MSDEVQKGSMSVFMAVKPRPVSIARRTAWRGKIDGNGPVTIFSCGVDPATALLIGFAFSVKLCLFLIR